jgi:hypothetical protein
MINLLIDFRKSKKIDKKYEIIYIIDGKRNLLILVQMFLKLLLKVLR